MGWCQWEKNTWCPACSTIRVQAHEKAPQNSESCIWWNYLCHGMPKENPSIFFVRRTEVREAGTCGKSGGSKGTRQEEKRQKAVKAVGIRSMVVWVRNDCAVSLEKK